MFKEPVKNFQLQPLLTLDVSPYLLSRQIEATITKRILVVPGWLSRTFHMFQDALPEMVAEEFVQWADCRVHNMIKVKGETVHIV